MSAKRFLTVAFPQCLKLSRTVSNTPNHGDEFFTNETENINQIDYYIHLHTITTNWDAIHFVSTNDTVLIQIDKLFDRCASQNKSIMWEAIDSRFRSHLLERAQNYNYQKTDVEPCSIFYYPENKYTTVSKPDSTLVFTPLRAQDAELVNTTWKYGDADTLPFVKHLIETKITVGLFHEQKLVSWGLCQEYDAIGMMYTLEEHRRKGYARQVVLKMMELLLEKNIQPFGYITQENEASRNMFKRIGFEEGDAVDWITMFKDST